MPRPSRPDGFVRAWLVVCGPLSSVTLGVAIWAAIELANRVTG